MQKAATSAEPFVPEDRTLPVLRKAVQECRGCDLYRNATQAVFGEIEEKPKSGQRGVAVMMIGEQPGDKEDIEGRPFVGPAGKLLDQCLEEASIERSQVYVTNAVKHFKWEPRGKTPYSREADDEGDQSLQTMARCRDGSCHAEADRLSWRDCCAGVVGIEL